MKTIVACFLTAMLTATLLVGFNSNTAAAQTSGGKSDLISKTVQWAKDCVRLDNDGLALTARWNQISSTITTGATDFNGSNLNLTKTQMTAVITTMANIHTTYAAGNNTNVEVFQ